MAEEEIVYITRTQIASAQALIRVFGEDSVGENILKIARAKPNQRMVFRPYESAGREAS